MLTFELAAAAIDVCESAMSASLMISRSSSSPCEYALGAALGAGASE
jgi:hypothetical protein